MNRIKLFYINISIFVLDDSEEIIILGTSLIIQ